MGKKLKTAVDVTVLVAYCVWLAVSLFLWAFGLGMFIWAVTKETPVFSSVSSDATIPNWIPGWLIWGLFCVIPSIRFFLKEVRQTTRQGWNDGARHYTTNVTVTNTSVTATTKNHPYAYAILGFIVGALMGIIVGPVSTLAVIIRYIVKVVKQIKVVRANKPKNKPVTSNGGNVKPAVAQQTPITTPQNNTPTPQANQPAPIAIVVHKNEDVEKDIEVVALKLFGKDFPALPERFQQSEVGDIHVAVNESLEINGFEIAFDNVSKKTLLRLQAKNTSTVAIKSIMLDIVCRDKTGAKLGTIHNALLETEPFEQGKTGFEEVGIVIPKETALGDILIKRVTFEDGLFFDGESQIAHFETAEKAAADMQLYIKAHQGRR